MGILLLFGAGGRAQRYPNRCRGGNSAGYLLLSRVREERQRGNIAADRGDDQGRGRPDHVSVSYELPEAPYPRGRADDVVSG